MIVIETAEAYLTDDMNMIEITRNELQYAVVEVDESGTMSKLLALFANRHDALSFASIKRLK